MPAPINLLKAFEKGYLVKLEMLGGESKSPPPRSLWIILDGLVSHVTGTTSQINIRRTLDTLALRIIKTIDTAIASGISPLFEVAASTGGQQSQFTFFIITDEMEINLVGAATATAILQILEWTP